MLIRQENSNDFDEVYSVVKAAFEVAEHSDGTEQDLVIALRKSDSFVPELSLVAEIDGKIAGHIMFTEGKVGNDKVLVLAPLAIAPEYQKKGVGSALIIEGHKIAKQLGYKYSNVLGSESYYSRFGYIKAEQLGIQTPYGIPPENFMAIKLQENAQPINGAMKYPKEFGI
ncbi:GNAT family N-acetyltransferase [Clostridium ihumii]|uniref:GNAT family N-acetyltransferase n=1 Tax=Clostridium ihumii TaxID=1470356 RepID=UPI00058EFE38|nr:N-acetyltransferase [Clostridium ihumii]